jgi:nucleotide-binding universal stress UspA family protein
MSKKANDRTRRVLVVGIDLTEVSEHLLTYARDLVRWVDDAELHVVHVVRREPLSERVNDRIGAEGIVTSALRKAAEWELEQLCRRIVGQSSASWQVHVRVGNAADVLTHIAADLDADFIVLEAHDDDPSLKRVFHRSIVARIARDAPCSVITIRAPRAGGSSAIRGDVAQQLHARA